MQAYYNGFRRSGIAKVHIVRTTPVNRTVSPWRSEHDWKQAWCGVSAEDTPASAKVPVDVTQPLDAGLTWCAACVGKAAGHAGLLGDVVTLILARGGGA